MQSANQAAGPLTMQNIIKKLLAYVSFPLVDFSSKVMGKMPTSQQFESMPKSITEVEYKKIKSDARLLPRKQNIMLKLLEEKLGLTNACLSSYIEFKRQALVLLIRAAAGR